MNILVVDDDELIRESMIPMLEIMGHSAQAAPGGLEALELMGAGLAVDLVILDMNMPGMNGLETLARIRRSSPTRWCSWPPAARTGPSVPWPACITS